MICHFIKNFEFYKVSSSHFSRVIYVYVYIFPLSQIKLFTHIDNIVFNHIVRLLFGIQINPFYLYLLFILFITRI